MEDSNSRPNIDQMSHKERILRLCQRNVPELHRIYKGTLNIIQRMLLCDHIEKVNWLDQSQSTSPEAIQKCYEGFLLELDKLMIEQTDSLMKTDLACLKLKILKKFTECPEEFIKEMAAMIHSENNLIKQYYFDQTPVQNSFETLSITQADSVDMLMEEVKALAETVKQELRDSSKAEKLVLLVHRVHGQRGQQQFNEMKVQCIQIGERCDLHLTSLFSKMENVKAYLKEAKRLFQKKLSYDTINLPMSEKVLSLQALDDSFQMWTSAMCSLKEEIASYETGAIEMYTRYPQGYQTDLYSKLIGHKDRLEQFLCDYYQMCLLTVKCPGNQYHKSSSSSSKAEPEDTEAPKKKATKTKLDKKENSTLNSTLKILGAKPFGQKFRINPNSSTIILVDENLLPEYLPEGTELQFKPDDITKCGKVMPESPPKLNDGFELKFYREEILEPTRSKSKSSQSDKESASLVVASFSRFWYAIDVEIYDRSRTLYAVSHPIGWRTGSNQLLQFNGSLTWYHWNVNNVYENLRIPPKVEVSKILDMLDEQVSNIKEEYSGNCNKTKNRSLSSNEREFLQSMLLGENSTSQYVTLRDFISCNKASDKKKRSHNDQGTCPKTLKVDFHTWFLALLKSLNGFLKGLWLDCIIYGICSEETTSEMLMREETPVGTIMLRPSTKEVHDTRRLDPYLDLVLNFKTNRGNREHVDSINWVAKDINHLPEALLTHGPTLQYIQGVNDRRWPVTILKNYFTNDSRRVYRDTVFKMTVSFEILPNGNDEDAAESTAIDEKKIRGDDPFGLVSTSFFESPHSIELPPDMDNQSMVVTSTQQGIPETVQGLSDSPASNHDEWYDFAQASSLPMSVLELQDCNQDESQENCNFTPVGYMYTLSSDFNT